MIDDAINIEDMDLELVGTPLQGPQGEQGSAGPAGPSAYDEWLALGNEGSYLDFIALLKGGDGKSAYEVWLDAGNQGSETAFLNSLKGEDGDGLNNRGQFILGATYDSSDFVYTNNTAGVASIYISSSLVPFVADLLPRDDAARWVEFEAPAGIDGKSTEMRRSGNFIQWRQEGGSWFNLMPVTDLVGPSGEDGKLQLVDLGAIEGPGAIGEGSYFLVPVISTAPASTIEDSVEFVLPYGDPTKRIAMYAEPGASNVTLTIGVVREESEEPEDPEDPLIPENIDLPSITGNFEAGFPLTVSGDTWSNSPTSKEYRWFENSTIIPGATSVSYTPLVGQMGDTISAQVRAINSEGPSVWIDAEGASDVHDGSSPPPVILPFYIMPGQIQPLGLAIDPDATYSISYPPELNLMAEEYSGIYTPEEGKWVVTDAVGPFPIQDTTSGMPVVVSLDVTGADAASATYVNDMLVGSATIGLGSADFGLAFPETSDPLTNQVPPGISITWEGMVPNDHVPRGSIIFGSFYAWNQGEFAVKIDWDGTQSINGFCISTGAGTSLERVFFHEYELVKGTPFKIHAEYLEGNVSLYIDDVLIATKPVTVRPRIIPEMGLFSNNSSGNFNNASNIHIKSLAMSFSIPGTAMDYVEVPQGPVTAEMMSNLVVDASDGIERPIAQFTYQEDSATLGYDVIVSELPAESGQPYKLVLEDWSTGVGVPQANELVMTRPAKQNVGFEAPNLNYLWTEVQPVGDVPKIEDIFYGCEGIRMGTDYFQFQIVYWLDQPATPFGETAGLDTYMVPHKWKIYDINDVLIDTIERPDGGPLNGTDIDASYSGTLDGRGIPMIDHDVKTWYPHGTARSSIIWRNRDPAAYTQSEIYQNMPVYQHRVPFMSHTGYSVNGSDVRAGHYAFNVNGFGNWLNTPLEPFELDYDSIVTWAGNHNDPYTGPYSAIACRPNAGIWMSYTPFNIAGRSPLNGPGGTRNDRQAQPEVVGLYAGNVASVRPVDGTPMRKLALDYLTSYASEPYHLVENGRATPLFKNNPQRNIGARNHYYGYGDAARPANQSFYAQAGHRSGSWLVSLNPVTVQTPEYGVVGTKPAFGTFNIDQLHAHQFPYWGSSLFHTPEFVMLGNAFTDQCRLYENDIFGDSVDSWAGRDAAWTILHASLAWYYGSKTSDRIYSRSDILDWIIFDFEKWATNYGELFFNPPTDIWSSGSVDTMKVRAKCAEFFGSSLATSNGYYGYSEFQVGYWLSAMHSMHFFDMPQAIRARSAIAGEVYDWIEAQQVKRVLGRINEAMDMNVAESEYSIPLWFDTWVNDASTMADLPQTYGDIRDRMILEGKSDATVTWDMCKLNGAGSLVTRDGQGMDLLLAGPAMLQQMGYDSPEMQAAKVIADNCFNEKYNEELAKGEDAGQGWFIYSQISSMPPVDPNNP